MITDSGITYTFDRLPQSRAELELLADFKNRTKSDIYVWVVKHWDRLKQKNGNDYSLDAATKDFVKLEQASHARHGSFFTRLKALLQQYLAE